MAHIIETGKTEAIPLKSLRSSDILQIDEKATSLIERNGGFADWLIEMRRGLFTFLRIQEQYPLQPKQQKKTV
jgi:hypothetical protein